MNFIQFNILDIIDILVVALLLFQVYKVIRGTAAMTIFVGIFLVYLLWVVVQVLNMELLSLLLGQVIGVGTLALVIVFQQEVRQYLLMLGRRYSSTREGFFKRLFTSKEEHSNRLHIQDIAIACYAMSASRTGALIAIENSSDLEVYATTGDRIDAEISNRLIQNIFFKNAPLHDGAVIIKNNRIWAARCILPSSDNPHIPADLGMRHRAAIGLTEHSDAIVIVVSEETGTISVIEAGDRRIIHEYNELLEALTNC